MSDYKTPMDLTPCAPHLIAVHFADESYTPTPRQQKSLCDEMWRRWANHKILVEALQDAETALRWYKEGDQVAQARKIDELLSEIEAAK